jgi:transposase-like protein
MKAHDQTICPNCDSSETSIFKRYNTVHNGTRHLYQCRVYNTCFYETSTPMENLKTPLSKVASALKFRSEGLGLRATTRVLGAHKRTIGQWEKRFSGQKNTLMLYAFCHEVVSLTFEGDELYTIVGERTDPSDSKGLTAVIMERCSRFIVDQKCGKKDAELFKSVMDTVCQYINHTDNLSFFSDGERRYGNMLFALCAEVLRTGKCGCPPKVLPKGVKVRVKNKGEQKHKRGPKRPKYQAPQGEHSDTDQSLPDTEIHANHVKAQNAAMQRRNSAFRRRTNTYAKTELTLDVIRLGTRHK